MMDGSPPRVMWLLNHGAARKFEIAMLKAIGIREIFLPKSYPNDITFRSASVDYSEDANLTIPKDELELLNATDWYGGPTKEAWDIANRRFGILFFILHRPEILTGIARHYQGMVLWRVYGLDRTTSYARVVELLTRNQGQAYIQSLGRRFFFAQAYPHLHEIEPDYLKGRRIYLPLGLHDCEVRSDWNGGIRKIFFICPQLGFNSYYKTVYDKFRKDFKGLPYAVGGDQPIAVSDPNVLGFVPEAEHRKNMREMRVMYYQSDEPNHIHYHPFEAIRAGMPLVFMGDGMLDRLGGRNLPGRCGSVREARRKLERILGDDWNFIEDVRKSQVRILDSMRSDAAIDAWKQSFQRIETERERLHLLKRRRPGRRRIAVILPIGYRGGSLRGALLVAQAFAVGSRQADETVDVVFGHLDDGDTYSDAEFADLPDYISRRPFKWRIVRRDEARAAMAYAGATRALEADVYQVPDDGINQFMDCDLWVIVSDRLDYPLLPVRPYVSIIYDYLQRYEKLMSPMTNRTLINVAQNAERILVTTEFSRSDAIQFAGIADSSVVRVPMLAPDFGTAGGTLQKSPERRHFLWTTNLAPHKNHENALRALRIYYERYGGKLDCVITGVNTQRLFKEHRSHLKAAQKLFAEHPVLRQRLKIQGELPDDTYRARLAASEFLWHAGRIDNGTFSVVEAAHLGVPSLASEYPAMREIQRQFGIDIAWMDAWDPEDMARGLKRMEEEAPLWRAKLPPREQLERQSVEHLAADYWSAIGECL